MVLILSFDLVFNTSPTDFKEIFIKNVCAFGVSVMLSEIRDDIVDRQANNIADVTVRFDCNTTSVEQDTKEDTGTNSDLSESDTEKNIQVHYGQLNDEEMSDFYD